MEFAGAALFAFFFSAKGAGFDARLARPFPLRLIRTPKLTRHFLLFELRIEPIAGSELALGRSLRFHTVV
jgi:hypothetical protein